MWHDIVSTGNRAADFALAQSLDTFWRHPLVASGFLSVLLVLVSMFWIETLKEQAVRRDEPVERPILVRR